MNFKTIYKKSFKNSTRKKINTFLKIEFLHKFSINNLSVKYNLIHNLYFKEIKNPILQWAFAKKKLDFIEIEVFSFCNRTCWFCPNSKIDRHSKNVFMEEKTYLGILEKLKQINYKGLITYSRYNEPLADKIILKRIEQARKYLPKAFLYTHSNGDYITREYLEELSNAGLDFVRLQCYLAENEQFDIENVIKPKMQKMIEKLNLPYAIISRDDYYGLTFEHPKISVIFECIDFSKKGVNRGGTVDKIKGINRTKPCVSPFYRMYIDYNGSVMPCCQVRHDVPEHKHMILGNVNKNNIFEIFSNKNYADIRKHLVCNGEKMFPCNTCSATMYNSIYDSNALEIVKNMIKQYKKD